MVYRRPSSNERVLRICQIMLKLLRRQFCSAVSLASEFGVDSRTVKRDIDLLRDIPIPIAYDFKKKTYYIDGNGMYSIDGCHPLETLMLIVGLTALQRVPSGMVPETIDALKCRLLYKLPQNMRGDLRIQVDAVNGFFSTQC